jgi:hypothetical protein
MTNPRQTGKKELFFDASRAQHTPPKARPMEEQDERESQRLWHDVTEAVKIRDQETATTAKAKIEDRQRAETAQRNNEGIDWHPQLFRPIKGGPGGPDEGEEDLDWIISAKMQVFAVNSSVFFANGKQRWKDSRGASRADTSDTQHTAWPEARKAIRDPDTKQQYPEDDV